MASGFDTYRQTVGGMNGGMSSGFPSPYAPQTGQRSGGGMAGNLISTGLKTALPKILPKVLPKVFGAGTTGGGLLSGFGGASLTNPWTAAAMAIPFAIQGFKQIGRGRRAADRLTTNTGTQGLFGREMEDIAAREGRGEINASQRQTLLSQALDRNIQQGIRNMGKDPSKDSLVMKQWLSDFSNPNWVHDHPYLQPIAQKYMGYL